MNELLIRCLNEQLVSEYEATWVYLYQYARLKGGEARQAMGDFSKDELEHARMLIDYIVGLGGEPAFIIPQIHKDDDEVKALIRSISAEESAIRKYTMIKEMIDNPGDLELFEKSIEMEKEHHKRLTEILKKVKQTYREKGSEK